MKHAQCFLFLLIFCLLTAGVSAETETPQKVEEVNLAAMEDAGWVVTITHPMNMNGFAQKEKNGAEATYYSITMKPEYDEQGGPRIVFGSREIVAESIELINKRTDRFPSTYEQFVYRYYSGQPVAIIIRGKELYGEKRTYVALRRKYSWEFYSMRPEIRWRLEFSEDREPEFAAEIKFDEP